MSHEVGGDDVEDQLKWRPNSDGEAYEDLGGTQVEQEAIHKRFQIPNKHTCWGNLCYVYYHCWRQQANDTLMVNEN